MKTRVNIQSLTPAERRALLASMLADKRSQPAPAVGAPIPLSFQQERLWFLSRLLPDSSAYNIPAAVVLEGYLSRDLLQQALNRIVERHAILRTGFVESKHGPVQVIDPEAQVELGFADLSNLAPEEQERVTRRRAFEVAAMPHDLVRPPLVRALLLRQSASRHVLVLSIHHIVFDGWSMGLLFNEFSATYREATGMGAAGLTPLRLQYHDYARRQREPSEQARLNDALRRRVARLNGAAHTLDLPSDRPRPATQSLRGKVHLFALDKGVVEKLETWGRARQASPFMTWLSVFALLLHRLSGRDDLVIGSPVANRPRPELENLIGLFVDNLVLRIPVDEHAGADALLKAVRAEVLEAMTCQELPFERLVETLGVARDMSRNPVFQVMFVHQNAAGGATRTGQETAGEGLGRSALHVDSGTSKFDLTLYAATGGEAAEFSFEYSTDLFEPATIERWARTFVSLAERIAEDSAVPLSRLPSLYEQDERQIARWNATRQSYAGPECLHELIRLQAGRSPRVPAVMCAERTLSYRDLDEFSDRLAHRLLDMGLGPSGHVVLLMEGSIEMLVAALAVMKAGGAYVPIDPSYPQARIDAMLEDCDARVVLGTGARRGLLERVEAPVCLVDEELDSLPAAGGPPAIEVHPEQPAYMIYTSGSTGRPKGVINRHRAICNRLNWMQQAFELGEGERVLQKTSVSFDVSVWELFWPLICGATVVVAAPEGRKDPMYLGRLIEESGITTAHFVPSLLEAFLDITDLHMPRSLRRVICSGETLGPALARRFFERSTAELYNLYGPTEAAIDVTWWRCERDAPADEPVPVGRPLANTSIYILDERMKPVPVGVPGELYIGGVQLADRYHRRPQTTAAAFVPDPWSQSPGARMYRSGDRARFLPSGAIEFIGRMDGQIKLRGHRIELGEIEHALRRALPLQSAAVVLNGQDSRNKQLVAYLVPAPNAQLPAERDIRLTLASVLPAPMIPSFFVVLECMPLGANGKIDRRNLARRAVVHAGEVQAHRAPRTATEALLADIWREVLDVDPIGVHDDFFEIGGHSLRVAQVAYRIRAKLGVDVALGVLFERPTIAEVAEYIDGLAAGTRTGNGAAIAKAPRRSELPLSFSQEHLWFLSTLLPDNPFYNMPVLSRLDGFLDGAVLERSLLALVDRHEALRTVFGDIDGRPVQTVVESYRPELRFEDLSMVPAEQRMKTAVAHAEREAMRPFKLDGHPPLRCLVLRLDARHHLLLLTLHHIIADGWSIGILARELHTLYAAELEQRTPALEPLPIQFPDFAYWQRSQLQGECLEELSRYWTQHLRDAPVEVRLPFDRPRPLRSSLRGALHSFTLASDATAELKTLCRGGRATLFMALLLGFNLLLLRRSGQTDQVLGIPIANRNRPELENLVGFFVNTLVLRVDLSGDPPVREALERVRKVTLAAYEHQDMPFEKLVEQLQPSRNSGRNPLFNVMFAYQNIPFQLQVDPRSGSAEEAPVVVTTRTSKFDLTLFIEGEEDTLRGAIEYDTELFDAENIEGMAASLQEILRELGRDPDRPISSLLGPSREDLARLDAWAGREASQPPAVGRIEERFYEQVRYRPEAVALRQGARRLSYAELDRMALALAARIVATSVRVGDIVAVALGRGIERVAAILAILKVGGTCLPLDPDDPPERLAYVLRDSGARLLLADREAPFKPDGIELVHVAEGEAEQAGLRTDAVSRGVSPGAEQAAYVIYTSGSTGRPKGVAVSHRALAGLLAWQQDRHPAVASTAHVSSLGFDVAFQEMFCTLCAGGALVLPEAEVRRDPVQLPDFVQAEAVERLFLTPLALRQLAEAVVPGERYDALRPLRQVFVAGEQLYLTPTVRTLFGRLRGCTLYNQYGPTETHVVTEEEVSPEHESPVPPIGRPIDNSRVYVLDARLRRVPVGTVGELCLGGCNLASGYPGRAAQTAERFVPDPFARTPGARMYRTGDRARFLGDGRLLFLGRMDHQLKIRGYRVEPGEIESLLSEQPDVEAAAVLAADGVDGTVELIAYVAAVPGKRLQVPELRAHLARFLPNYMLPSRLMVLDVLPVLPSGKLDRRALPDPGSMRGDDASFVAPRTPLEKEIAAIWQELLRLARVGVHDDFFALGGHSLIATQVAARLHKQFDVQLPVSSLFEYTTVESLAVYVLGQTLMQGEGSSTLALLEDVEERQFFANAETTPDSEFKEGEMR